MKKKYVLRNIPKIDGYTKKDTIFYLKQAIKISDEWARFFLLKTYEGQTDNEKDGFETERVNAQGFSKYDSPFLTFMARKAQNREEYVGQKKELLVEARELTAKYAAQVAEKMTEEELRECIKFGKTVSPQGKVDRFSLMDLED